MQVRVKVVPLGAGQALCKAALGGAFLASNRTRQAPQGAGDHEEVALADAGCAIDRV